MLVTVAPAGTVGVKLPATGALEVEDPLSVTLPVVLPVVLEQVEELKVPLPPGHIVAPVVVGPVATVIANEPAHTDGLGSV